LYCRAIGQAEALTELAHYSEGVDYSFGWERAPFLQGLAVSLA